MNKELILYRNELKNRSVPKYKLIGIVSGLILSKDIFLKNAEVEEFILDVFELHFKLYVFRSRSLITARLAKYIYSSEQDDKYKRKLYDFINIKIEEKEKK